MNNKSFTLLELIIVLAILAILVSAAVVKFTDIHCKAVGIVEQATMDALRGAVLLYKAQYGTWPYWVNSSNPSAMGPFSLLENPPSNVRNRDAPPGVTTGQGTHWTWYVWDGDSQFATRYNIYCPHTYPGDTAGKYWKYLQSSGQIAECGNPVTKAYSAGAVVRCPQLNLPPVAATHCH